MCVCVHLLPQRVCVRVCISLACVCGMCSSLAVPQEGSVGLQARWTPASLLTSQHGRISQASIPTYVFLLFSLLHSPSRSTTVGISFLGRTAL